MEMPSTGRSLRASRCRLTSRAQRRRPPGPFPNHLRRLSRWTRKADPGIEVATVKPSPPDARGRLYTVRGTQVMAINVTLLNVITFAYDLARTTGVRRPGMDVHGQVRDRDQTRHTRPTQHPANEEALSKGAGRSISVQVSQREARAFRLRHHAAGQYQTQTHSIATGQQSSESDLPEGRLACRRKTRR